MSQQKEALGKAGVALRVAAAAMFAVALGSVVFLLAVAAGKKQSFAGKDMLGTGAYVSDVPRRTVHAPFLEVNYIGRIPLNERYRCTMGSAAGNTDAQGVQGTAYLWLKTGEKFNDAKYMLTRNASFDGGGIFSPTNDTIWFSVEGGNENELCLDLMQADSGTNGGVDRRADRACVLAFNRQFPELRQLDPKGKLLNFGVCSPMAPVTAAVQPQ